MEAILKQLASPEWWFSVVFIGLLVSAITDPIKNFLNRVLAATFKRFGEYINRRKTRRNAEIKLLAADTNLLIIEYIRATFYAAATITLIVLSFLSTAWDVLKRHYPEVDPLNQFLGIDPVFIHNHLSRSEINLIMQFALFIPAMYFWNKFLRLFQLCEEARLFAKNKIKSNQFK